ncbi:DUF4332 domain-containing protein [Kitasatospora sp. NPDC057015]|uniref:DUF4332 domain-containing protein n=1 Tax=Kitasatospora sp. NPDC057015 TaxID=3346001 RepID=UPI0036268BB3
MIAFRTSDWDAFYSSWLRPVAQLLIPLAIALVVLVAVSGLLTRFVVHRDALAWSRPARSFWSVVGGLAVLAAATFLSVYPMFHPFADGRWLPWAFLFGVVAPGVTLAVLASGLRIRYPIRVDMVRPVTMPRPTSWILLLVWALLVSCFFSWGVHDRLLVAYVALAVLGITATATALGQNLRLEIEAHGADGNADGAASDYVLARLQSLGSKVPDLPVSRANQLSNLLSENLSAIPAGAVASTVARVMYAFRPGLTWRARITLVDINRVTITLTRNGQHVRSDVISRRNLGLAPLRAAKDTPELEEERGRARAQLLTGVAACILVELSRTHPHLRAGLCGARQWRSVALQVIATEPALTDDLDTRLTLLQDSVTLEPRYGPGRLNYLETLIAVTPKTIENRLRFAELMDAQLPLTLTKDKKSIKGGWELIHMHIQYSRAAMRVNAYLMARSAGEQRIQQLSSRHKDVLDKADTAAGELVEVCNRYRSSEDVGQFADYMRPQAESLQSAIAFLVDEVRQLLNGGQWTWPPPKPDRYPSPLVASYYATLAGLVDEYGIQRGDLGDTLAHLAFACATTEDRRFLRQDPAFWKLMRDPCRRKPVESALGLKPPGMLDLPPFRAYSDRLTAVGITTFEQLQRRLNGTDAHSTLAAYLDASPLVVSHLAEIAELATTHRDLSSVEVLQLLLDAGIASRSELRRRVAANGGLVGELATEATERYGLNGLSAFTAPEGWQTALGVVRQSTQRLPTAPGASVG